MKPGEGKEVVHVLAGINTTLTCAVSGIVLLWEVNGFRFGESTDELNRRGIFQSQLINSSDILNSTLSVFGSDTNHEGYVCCLSRMSLQDTSLSKCCTMLHVYCECQ